MSGLLVPFVAPVSPEIAFIRGRATHQLLGADNDDERRVCKALQGAQQTDAYFIRVNPNPRPRRWGFRSFYRVRNGNLSCLGALPDGQFASWYLGDLIGRVWVLPSRLVLPDFTGWPRPVARWGGKRSASPRKRGRFPVVLRLARGVSLEVPEPANDTGGAP